MDALSSDSRFASSYRQPIATHSSYSEDIGTGAPYINGGDVKNTGVELVLTWDAYKLGKDFKI